MTDHFVTVGDDLALPPAVKVLDGNLPPETNAAALAKKAPVASPSFTGTVAVPGAWDAPLKMGVGYLWLDAAGAPRYKGSAPTSITDGAPLLVGGQAQISRVNGTVIGNGGLHTPAASTNTALEASTSIVNPSAVFMGALSGYAYYSGTEGTPSGSIQGGACEAYSALTGTIGHAVLGWENIGTAVGTGIYGNVIGGQSTAQANDTVTVQNLIGYQGRGPLGTSPNVTNAYTMKNLEPTVGLNKWTYHGIGQHRFVLGADPNSDIVQIAGTSDVRRWGFKGDGRIVGYASDGTSTRFTIDPADTPTSRIDSNIFAGTGNHLTAKNSNVEVLRIERAGRIYTGADVEFSAAAAGVVLKSANGTRYRLTVGDDGALTTTAI